MSNVFFCWIWTLEVNLDKYNLIYSTPKYTNDLKENIYSKEKKGRKKKERDIKGGKIRKF